MKKILCASTNSKVVNTVFNVCCLFPDIFCAGFASETKEAINHIDYELPEIKVLDFSSETIDCKKILEIINLDGWLHYGGVIAVCKDRNQVSELEELKDMNMLAIQTLSDFEEHFARILRILCQNQQFLFNRGMRDIAGGLESGTFVCGNDPMDLKFYTNFLISYLYNTDRISRENRMSLQMTFSELLTNALEHGNLEINYEMKSEWLEKGGNIIDLIKKIAAEPEYEDRKIYFSYEIGMKSSVFSIQDDGKGFDWKKRMSEKADKALHGRGISLSRELVKNLLYNEKGNKVTFEIENQQNFSNEVPQIVQPFPIIEYKNHQIVCKQGEMSTDLFFILSGRFAVYVDKKLASVLTTNDLFIGEMAFLLNDRRTATVIAIGDCKLIKVPKGDFLAMIRRNPHYGIFLSKMLAQRLVRQTKNTNEMKNRVISLGGKLAE